MMLVVSFLPYWDRSSLEAILTSLIIENPGRPGAGVVATELSLDP